MKKGNLLAHRIILMTLTAVFSACSSKPVIDRENYHSVFQQHEGEIHACYKSRLKVQPALKGVVRIDTEIGDGGKVTKAEVSKDRTTLNDRILGECIVARVQTWKFPSPPEYQAVDVSYPYTFSP